MTPRIGLIQISRNRTVAERKVPCNQLPSRCLRRFRGHSSAAPKTERRLPKAPQPSAPRQWLRYTGLGGLALGSGYLVYCLYLNEQSRDAFKPYKLVEKHPVSSTASLFVLEPEDAPHNRDEYEQAWQKGIWSVQFKQPQLQIVRAYTPVLSENSQSTEDSGQLRFLIRNDAYGEVSSYLHRLPIGSQIELRGPNMEYEISPDVKQVVFFAGGTGIAPALQVAHVLFGSKLHGKDRKLHILWANRKREDCVGGQSDDAFAEPMTARSRISGTPSPPQSLSEGANTDDQGLIVRELEQLKKKHPGQVTVEYFVNEENTWIDKDSVCKALSRFDDKDFSVTSSSAQEQRQILISGPSGFISYLAGPKEWRGGKEQQGGVSKILAHAISNNPHNVKVWKI